ncbi:tyrosine-type recombinase/integrase [Microcoleus sp. Pol11C1]|uniref:tyrosine-type recombinase/integrase n=1 Tax=unclassified Microcoleus TaxID=2642155 RepID=UPI002FD50568
MTTLTITRPNLLTFPTLDNDPDVLAQLLADKRSINTRRAYAGDVRDFFRTMTGQLPTKSNVTEFLRLTEREAVALVLKWKAVMMSGEGRKKPLAEATINRRLAAIKSLVTMGLNLGVCDFNLARIKGETVQKYRDTTGIDKASFERILSTCKRKTVAGKRDYALLRLLWGNALRRNEVSQLSLKDFNLGAGTLQILGKGKGTQYQSVDVGPATVAAIKEWLAVRPGIAGENDPLFVALDFATIGHRITGDGIYKLVQRKSKAAGIEKQMSPHRIRHSAITAALDATDGNVRKVQKLSRHKNLNTLMIYDDNRGRDQHEVTELLDGMF